MAASRYNVLLLMLDDVNPDAWSKMARLMGRVIPEDDPGNWVDCSNFYVNYALCGPSRYSFLTGRYVRHLGVFSHYNSQGTLLENDGPWNGTPVEPESLTAYDLRAASHSLPVWLQQVGYNTAGFGKFCNEWPYMRGDLYRPPGWDYIDFCLDDHSMKYDPAQQVPPGSGPANSIHASHTGPDYFNYVRAKDDGTLQVHGTTDTWTTIGPNQSGRHPAAPNTAYITDLYSKQIQDWLAAAVGPWFCYWALRPTHNPVIDPADENIEYGVAARHRGLNASVFTLPNGSTVALGPQGSAFDPPNFDEADISDKPAWFQAAYPTTHTSAEKTTMRKERHASWRTLQAVDEAIYDIVLALTAQTSPNPTTGVVEPTIDHTVIMVTNDNAFTRYENRAEKKTTPYQASIHSRLIVRHPDVHPNKGGPGQHTEQALFSMVDLAPTICAIAGVRPTRAFDGMDITRRLIDTSVGWRREIRGEFGAEVGSIALGAPTHSWIISQEDYDPTPKAAAAQLWKYVLLPATSEDELYDLTGDPWEMDNKANNGAFASIKTEMAKRRSRLHSV